MGGALGSREPSVVRQVRVPSTERAGRKARRWTGLPELLRQNADWGS